MIHLHTLGDTLIKVGEKSIRPTSPLMFAALLYLGMERGRRVPRAALQELLFPKMDERSGAHSLRQLLYKLRQLRAPIEVDASTVFVAAVNVHDDTSRILEVSGVSGGFLPDYTPAVSERFTEWLDQQRASVNGWLRRQLVAAIEASRETLDWVAVERYASLLDLFDPFNEVGVLARAEAAALSGAKAQAMHILKRYENETGRSDLQLPAAVLRKRIARSVKEPLLPFANVPFRGREAEILEIRRHLSRARHGVPSLLMIGGAAGIGKTRLIEETAGLAALEGVSVFTVRCQSHYAGRPLSVFIDLVPALLGAPGALGISPESLIRLKSLTLHTDEASSLAATRDSQTRSELLLAAVRDLVDAVAAEQALMICVEDVHWADTESLRELARLVHFRSDHDLMIVVTSRGGDVVPPALAASDRLVVLRLKPLPSPAMEAIARHLLSPRASLSLDEVTEWCAATASGNPLLLQMLCAHYVSSGEAFVVPPDMRSAITTRVEHLAPAARRILELITLLGRHATLSNVRELWDSTPLQMLDAIQHLEENGCVQLVENVLQAHILVGEVALAMVPPASKCLMHGFVAAALERQYDATRDASILWDCTEQWKLSGEVEKAVSFLRCCARHAIAIGGSTDALNLLGSARRMAARQPILPTILGEIMLAARMSIQWDVANEASLEFDAIAAAGGEYPHNDIELASIDTCWYARLDDEAGVTRAFRCIHAPNASDEHKVHAARLVFTIAQERCDTVIAEKAYQAVAGLLRSERFADRHCEMFYHAIFGDRCRVPGMARTALADIASIKTEERMRLAYSIVIILDLVGEYDLGQSIATDHCALAASARAATWVYSFAVLACTTSVLADDFESALKWVERIEAEAAEDIGRPRHAMPITNQLEIAIWKRDAATARARLLDARGMGGSTARFAGYLRGAAVRVDQIDDSFLTPEDELQELIALFQHVKAFGSADSIADAVCESLLRTGRAYQALKLLNDYSPVRREGRALSPILEAKRCSAALAAHASLADLRFSENTRLRGAVEASLGTGGNNSRHT